VQAVVRIANHFKIPVYAISTGKNLTYGGSAPVYSGSVVIDLKRMNRILEVSERNAYALVEPGVSYFDLYRHIRENKLKVWIDCPDPGWGSPLGNSLDHGAGYTGIPYRDHFDAHCGMEIVLANGELVRTGMGALPESETWQQFKYGMGPTIDGLFAQSNFGIVTKMGFWLMPEPEAALAVTVTVANHAEFAQFCDALIGLMYAGLIQSQTSISNPVLNGPPDPQFADRLQRWDGTRSETLDAYARKRGVPAWSAPFVFYGPEKVIRAQWEVVQSRLSAIASARFTEDAFFKFPLSEEQVRKVADPARLGIPSLAYFASRHAPGEAPLEGHIDFSPIVPMRAAAILEALEVFGRHFAQMGVAPLGALPLFYHTRAVTIIYAIPTGRDPDTNRKAREAISKAIEIGGAHGWGEYRIHPEYMDKAVGLYNFNNRALLRVQEELKDAIDPNGILSAGRYGIWPKHLRGVSR
jgi:FAD/FMN-containing dehydrogenase